MKIAIPIFASGDKLVLNNAYVEYVSSSGLIPTLVTKHNDPITVANENDGLLLPGGIDLEPTYYGENNIASRNCNPEMDSFERSLLQAFIDTGKKVFGICRGFQLAVREFLLLHPLANNQISFYQNITGHTTNSDRNVARSTPTHAILANMKKLYGINSDPIQIFVNSMHHQALVVEKEDDMVVNIDDENYLHGLAATKYSTPSVKNKSTMVVEAVEIRLFGSTILGVQWHPEELMDVALLSNYFLNNTEEVVQQTIN